MGAQALRTRPDARAESAFGLRAVACGSAGDAETGTWRDRERRGEGGVRSPRWRGSVRGFQGRGSCLAGFVGGRTPGYRSAGELDSSEHHRYGTQPAGDAEGGLCEVAEA